MPILHQVVARPESAPFTDRFLDTLYQYLDLIGRNAERPIAKFHTQPPQGRVAIIGAGAAGMCAAYELLKAGVVPTVLEATDRIGGRAWSQRWEGAPNAFAELGSMRVPPVHVLFFTYAKLFGMTTVSGGFPDPGVVPTLLYYQNQRFEWEPNKPPPGLFARIQTDFNAFVSRFTEPIYAAWGNWALVTQEWQKLIDQYRNMTFYEAVVKGIPSWTTEDLNAFGALGVGSGGFGPLYQIGFLEMLRVLITEWETSQQLFAQGMTALEDGFYQHHVDSPWIGETSLAKQDAVRLRTPVQAVRWNPSTHKPSLYYGSGGGSPEWHEYDAVIVATTTRSMQMIDMTLPEPPDSAPINEDRRVALRNLHMTSSSKLFICTESKFWKEQSGFFPVTIQTDELPRGIYTLDYPGIDEGIVLVSYTWEDDSTKLLAFPKEERFAMLKEIITKIHPGFGAALVPKPGTGIYEVDWQCEPHYYGAFKLNLAGQEPYNQTAYYQFQSVLDPALDRGVYLAGDGVSWSGGWTEGALQTGLNAACAVAQRLGGVVEPDSPLTAQPEDRYNYGGFRALGFVDHQTVRR